MIADVKHQRTSRKRDAIRDSSQPPEIKPSRSSFVRAANVFQQSRQGTRNSSTKKRIISVKPTEPPEIKPSRSSFELATSFFRKITKTKDRDSKYKELDPREKPSSSVGSDQDHKKGQDRGRRAHSQEPQSKHAAPISRKDRDENSNPTLLTSIKHGGIVISSRNDNLNYYPTLPVKGAALIQFEEDGYKGENESNDQQQQLGYMPLGNAPDAIKRDIKEALENMKRKLGPVGEELSEPIGLVMTHRTFFQSAGGERLARWEQAVRDWDVLGAGTRSWDWVRDNSYVEFARLYGFGETGQNFRNSRNRDAVIEKDLEGRSHLEGTKCALNSFEDAITNLILKHTMFYCGQQRIQATREKRPKPLMKLVSHDAIKEAQAKFEEEREEKMMVDQKYSKVVEVFRERKLRRNDKEHTERMGRQFETAVQVNEDFLAWLDAGKTEKHSKDSRQRKTEAELEEKKRKSMKAAKGKQTAAGLFLGGLVVL